MILSVSGASSLSGARTRNLKHISTLTIPSRHRSLKLKNSYVSGLYFKPCLSVFYTVSVFGKISLCTVLIFFYILLFPFSSIMFNYQNYVYDKPYCRFIVYFTGLVLGYTLSNKFQIHPKWRKVSDFKHNQQYVCLNLWLMIKLKIRS